MRSLRLWAAISALSMIGLVGCGSGGGKSAEETPSSDGSSTSSAGVVSSEVSFAVNGSTTYGTLEMPSDTGGQPRAAALLISGSGPNDRDGNQPNAGVTPDTLKVVADLLARQGIITLRYDKYGSGKTGPYPGGPADFTLQGDLKQADSAYKFLAKQSGVDPQKLLVVGHSEGGMFALNVADTDTPKPAGIALLEPQDEHILDLIAIQMQEQTAGQVVQGQLSAAQAATSNQAVRRAIADFRAGKPVDYSGITTSTAAFLKSQFEGPEVAYTKSWDAADPVQLASQIPAGTRVLVTEGTRDTNVPAATVAPLVQTLRSAGATGLGLRTIPGTDHDMHLSTQPQNDAVLAPQVVAAIQQWAQPYAETD